MNYTIIKKFPPLAELMQDFVLSIKAKEKIANNRQEIKNILTGTDNRLLVIVGPCSAWPQEAVLDYAEKLLHINQKVKHALKLVMRVYTQKPRTTKGWAGPVNQPNPFTLPDIATGIKYTREMMLKIVEMGLPIADELLVMGNAKIFLELLSWIAIGARSSENQEHRIFSSAIDYAVGLKNPTHGSLVVGVNSVVAAQSSHVTIYDEHEVQTHGNPYAHLVLRGNHYGPNYSIAHLEDVRQQMALHQIKNPAVIIDASHDNCLVDGKKDHRLQPEIIFNILKNLEEHPQLKSLVKGFMLESFIKDGNQKIKQQESVDLQGLSITDPCLSWEQTEEFLCRLSAVKPRDDVKI